MTLKQTKFGTCCEVDTHTTWKRLQLRLCSTVLTWGVKPCFHPHRKPGWFPAWFSLFAWSFTSRRDGCNLASKEPRSPSAASPARMSRLPGLWLWHTPWSTPALQQRWPEAAPHVHYHSASIRVHLLPGTPSLQMLGKVFKHSPLLWVALKQFNKILSIEILKI